MSSAIESKKLSLQIVPHCDKYFKIYLYQDVTALKKLVLHNPVSVLTISQFFFVAVYLEQNVNLTLEQLKPGTQEFQIKRIF